MTDAPLVLVAQDLSPADMLQFKSSVFAGFVTDVGGKTSHTAIVARSMDIPAVVGARAASQLVRQDDWVIIDGDAGVVIVDPSPIILAEYQFRQRQMLLERERLTRLRHTPRRRWMARRSSCWPTSSSPRTAPPWSAAPWAWGCSAANSCSWAGRQAARRGRAVPGLPRRAGRHARHAGHHPHHRRGRRQAAGRQDQGLAQPGAGPARHPLEPGRAGDVPHPAARHPARGGAWQGELLFPMLAHRSEIDADPGPAAAGAAELDARGVAYGKVELGAMIEIPAAALMVRSFLQYFDFLSIGTNDLIQYTLAIDRADEAVAHLYDPLHPAVLRWWPR
jgi:phosphotransferase system enzyme I (PtsI)